MAHCDSPLSVMSLLFALLSALKTPSKNYYVLAM